MATWMRTKLTFSSIPSPRGGQQFRSYCSLKDTSVTDSATLLCSSTPNGNHTGYTSVLIRAEPSKMGCSSSPPEGCSRSSLLEESAHHHVFYRSWPHVPAQSLHAAATCQIEAFVTLSEHIQKSPPHQTGAGIRCPETTLDG